MKMSGMVDNMQIEIIVALISFAGTALGAFGGILTSGKLTSYRIEQLEKNAGTQFDPELTKLFISLIHRGEIAIQRY